jgi:hypothetical protein
VKRKVVDFKAVMQEKKEWKALGKQIVALIGECTEIQDEKQVCLHCHTESFVGEKGQTPLFEMHHEDCEVGKAQELIAKIRKRIKEKK